ncbi:MAG: GntR family transcriptional regulator [Deltaproteobacteria bacterium]|nr:GntR family transcriptional regulator [Deltaproteobacteria bacterium]
MKGIQKLTYSQQIREYIKECILNGEYTPGDKVNEVDIAGRLNVSRAPVREALQHLAEAGLLVSVPQKGKFITSLTARQIYDSYMTGGILEGAAVASTIHLFTETDFEGMEKLVREMAASAKAPNGIHIIAELDNAFHEHMFSKSDNKLLRSLSRRCCQGLSKFLLYQYWTKAFVPEEIHGRHQFVLDAVRSRDPGRIEQAVRTHYLESGRRMARYGSDVTPLRDNEAFPAHAD